MTDKLSGLNVPITPSRPIRGPGAEQPVRQRTPATQPFQDILESKLKTPALKFSAHAEARLRLRNIQLGPEELAKLENAMEKAKAKGARESLIVMEGNVFVVSVKNSTVITVVDRASARENVFTQIDSAVLTD